MITIAEGIATNVSRKALVGLVYPPQGWASWEDYENSFYPYWNECEGKWEY